MIDDDRQMVYQSPVKCLFLSARPFPNSIQVRLVKAFKISPAAFDIVKILLITLPQCNKWCYLDINIILKHSQEINLNWKILAKSAAF